MNPARALVLLCVASLPLSGLAQPATAAQMAGVKPDPNFGILHLETKVGSFKLLDGQGRVEIAFRGTILVHKLDGKLQVSQGLRKEFEGHDRVVYSGTGSIVATGKWRGIQWFGRNMKAVWYGAGVARLAGEFDKDLNTGKFWYSNPDVKSDWFASGTFDIHLPSPTDKPMAKPYEKKSSGG